MGQKLNNNSIKNIPAHPRTPRGSCCGTVETRVTLKQFYWGPQQESCFIFHFLSLPCQLPAPRAENGCGAGVSWTAQQNMSCSSSHGPEGLRGSTGAHPVRCWAAQPHFPAVLVLEAGTFGQTLPKIPSCMQALKQMWGVAESVGNLTSLCDFMSYFSSPALHRVMDKHSKTWKNLKQRSTPIANEDASSLGLVQRPLKLPSGSSGSENNPFPGEIESYIKP